MPGPRPEGRPPVNANGTGTLVVNGTLIINGGTVIINGGTLVVGGPAGILKGARLCKVAQWLSRRLEEPRLPMLDARAIFNRLDTNHDGKLSFEEFAVGLHLQQFLATRMGQLKKPLWDRIRSMHEKMGQFHGQFGHPGMGPIGQHPGMGPMGSHPGMGPMGMIGMGPMGGHPGMGQQMGMMRAFGSQKGSATGNVRVLVTMVPDGAKKAEVCKCGAKKGEPCKCQGVKKPEVCKCGAKKGEPCKCAAKKAVACSKCGAKTPEACTCGKKLEAKKCEAKKCEAEKPAAGHQSIEARLTASKRSRRKS